MTGSARSDAEKALNACLETDCGSLSKCMEAAQQSGGNKGAGGSAMGGSTTASSGGSAAGGSNNSAAGGSGSSVAGSGGSAGGSGGSAVGGSGGNANNGGSGGSSLGNSGGSAAGSTGSGAGGQAGATGGTSGSVELVVSGPDAYWSKGEVTQATSGTADVNVDKNTTYQRWDGFGGCFNEQGWDALSAVSADDIANAMKLLFDPQNGANFAYGRLPLGASDYAMSWYTLDDTAGDYSMDKFSLDRDRQKLIPFVKEALKVKSDLHLWASPWVVPGWMMDSGSNMKSDAQTLGAHALYLARFVEEYAKEGMKIEAIHPQNEPGYARVHWTQSLFINYLKTYLGPTLAKRNLTTEIWCGTMSKDPDDTNIAKATALDADAMKYVKGFGVQWNLQASVATFAAKAPVMQTEHKCGNYNFETPYWDKGRYNSSKPQNDHLYGEETWQLIRDWTVSGVSSYSAWNMVLDTVGMSLDAWPQNALLVVDRAAKKLIVTPAYYVFRHFSQYIAPGATRIGTSGSSDAFKGANNTAFNSLNALAFKNPDGSIIVQVYNKNASSTKATIGVGTAFSQTLYQFNVPAHGWATLRILP
jgi:glucosylceramidase